MNALLSLGYTLAGSYVGRLAVRFGLDPAIGLLHDPASDRNALALDLLEPVRPWVDEAVVTLVSELQLRPEAFHEEPGLGVRLSKEARSAFYAAWFGAEERWLARPARRAVARVLAELRREVAGGGTA